MPDALLLGVYPVEKFSDRFKRMSDLVSSSASGAATLPALSQPLYSPGDVIEFDDSTQTVVQEQSDLTIRHDLYLPDFTDLGISSDDLDEVKQIYADQLDELATLKTIISDIEVTIDTIQRKINEAEKVVTTINVAIAIKPSQALIEKQSTVNQRIVEYKASRNEYLAQLNSVNDQINATTANIRSLSALVN